MSYLSKTKELWTNSSAVLVCLAAGSAVPADWEALAATGSFMLFVDGTSVGPINPDFTGCITMAQVAGELQDALHAMYPNTTCVWRTDHFEITSPSVGALSSIGGLTAPPMPPFAVDLSLPAWANGVEGSTDIVSLNRYFIGQFADFALTAGTDIASVLTDVGTVISGQEGSIVAVNRAIGKRQSLSVAVTCAANAAPVTLCTVTTAGCVIKSIVVRTNAATTADLTNFVVTGGTAGAVEFIGAVAGAFANIDLQDNQVAWEGSVQLPAGGTIVFDPAGTGATALNFAVTIEYHAVANGGYLNP